MSHTPGPWTVSQRFNMWLIAKADGGYIAETPTVDVPYVTEAAANARLIAAAPDLLEALQAFRPMMADGCDCIYSCDDENSKRCPCKMMRAALAKAEGSSPIKHGDAS